MVLPEVGGLLRRPLMTLERVRICKRDGQPIHRAIVRRLRANRISGATIQRGIWGFHGDRSPHGDHFLQLGCHVPTVTTVIDTAEHISAAFDVIDELTSERGLVTSETISAMRSAFGRYRRGKL